MSQKLRNYVGVFFLIVRPQMQHPPNFLVTRQKTHGEWIFWKDDILEGVYYLKSNSFKSEKLRSTFNRECRIWKTSNSCAVPWDGCLKPPSKPKQIFSSLKNVYRFFASESFSNSSFPLSSTSHSHAASEQSLLPPRWASKSKIYPRVVTTPKA